MSANFPHDVDPKQLGRLLLGIPPRDRSYRNCLNRIEKGCKVDRATAVRAMNAVLEGGGVSLLGSHVVTQGELVDKLSGRAS